MNRPERPELLVEERPPRRRRLWLWMIVVVLLAAALFAAIFAFPIIAFTAKGFPAPPPATVSTTTAQFEEWQPAIQIVGSLKPVQGADLSMEVAGIVDEVDFDSGRDIAAGARLIRLIDADDVAKLHTLEAARDLAQTNYNRDQSQLERQLISQAQFDVTAANLKSLQAQVAEQQAIVAKKTLLAPFAGHLGIRAVNTGQFINPGTVVVTLQALDPIFIDFSLPQQQLQQIRTGQTITTKVDAYPTINFPGRITTIDPKVDPATRNVSVRATLPNRDHKLLPGMFATAEITTGVKQRFITLPQAAITFNPYGNVVYVVKQGKDPAGKDILTGQQTVVTTGATRGDQIAILSGLKEGDIVVSAGQAKLQNGAPLIVNNAVTPTNDPNPHPHEE
ncbi:MAG TPA: efflux RND transporter periplasmic adaptor subunit [Micropepsaceae bacterium]|nr:efflux RND transporter periplasmic adaptor subunit [Micropepsaceae bacterium]